MILVVKKIILLSLDFELIFLFKFWSIIENQTFLIGPFGFEPKSTNFED